MKRKFKINTKYVLVILIIILIILVYIYGSIINKHLKIKHFAENNMQVHENNKEQVFKVEKIVICSSANAIDLSEEKNLQDLNIYQYTDIAVYIDNGEEFTNKNTIKELYIDNISLEGSDTIGNKSLNYKNIMNFGLKHEIEENLSDNIKFNIIYTNEQNDTADYNEPTFFTDCSNPITLEYLNNNLVTNYKMDENKQVSFDGSILEDVGISTDSINCKVKFKINIINNQNEKYSCPINFQIPLDDIYEGTTMKAKTTNSSKYIFFRE